MKKSAAASKAVKLRVAKKQSKEETPSAAKKSGAKRVSAKAKALAREARKDEKEGRTSKWPD